MPRVKRRALCVIAAVVCGSMGWGAAACSGAVDLGSHAFDVEGSSDAESGADANGSTGSPGTSCGTRGAAPCDPSLFCLFEPTAQCGATDQGGTCTVPSAACPKDYLPVCGCNGATYANACLASAARTSVLHAGACAGDASVEAGAACGVRGTGPCPSPQVCVFPLSAECGATDKGSGSCRNVSSTTGCPAFFAPVCGCDGLTYTNECYANSEGMSARAAGECP